MRLLWLFLVAFTVACALMLCQIGEAGGKRAPAPEVPPSPSPAPITVQGVVFSPVDYYSTPAEREKIKRAGELLTRVVQSQCFEDFLRARPMIQTQGKTPAQVVSHIRNLSGIVPVKMYYRWLTSAVAYRQPPYLDINLNRKYFSLNLSDCEWASTMAHEGLGHALGDYTHDYKWNAQRDYSVPYSLNKAFQQCCR